MDIAVSLLTLTLLEVVLGIDNLIFIFVLADKLPEPQASKLRRWGLLLALAARLVLLVAASWMMKLTEPWLTIADFSLSGKDFLLIGGGLFLLGKATFEIHSKLEGETHENKNLKGQFSSLLFQVVMLDIVFSIDSVITAVGVAKEYWVMATAVITAIIIMLLLSEKIHQVIKKHPTLKILALSFLILIGIMLIADGFHHHIPRGYLYFAMGFSFLVEILNIQFRKKGKSVKLNEKFSKDN